MVNNKDEQLKITRFYDEIYYANLLKTAHIPHYLKNLAKSIPVFPGQKVLDVACGTGQWLMAAATLGAQPSGVDISQKAINYCQQKMPNGYFHCGTAESLPFSDSQFDLVSCFGALEHFIDPAKALLEMVRVAKTNAIFILLVPNTDFLTAKLGIYKGTHQAEIKEEAKTVEEWSHFFEKSGLHVIKKWRDLHILNLSWIIHGRWYTIPFRLMQALILPFWPLRWQYQIYFQCQKKTF